MKRIIISGPGFCAVKEDEWLVEYCSREKEDQAGTVLIARIERIMAGSGCAFVDIGRKKSGFLPLDESSKTFAGEPVRSGETLILQIKKEEAGDKGAYLTRDITLPGRLVILMPMNRYIGVSSRITDEETRDRLKTAGMRIAEGRFGLVLRNAAAEAEERDIRQEAEELYALWRIILEKAAAGGKPGKILFGEDPLDRLLKDYAATGIDQVTEEEKPDEEILRQLSKAKERKLTLPSGGNIVIDRCEAMTVIDVNTASAGAGDKKATVLETNLEACDLIARQVRLRSLGGMILIDFIDMDTVTDQSLVCQRLTEAFRPDRIKTLIHGWTRLGLMEMTRKRTRSELNP